jgi:hypothetical protein
MLTGNDFTASAIKVGYKLPTAPKYGCRDCCWGEDSSCWIARTTHIALSCMRKQEQQRAYKQGCEYYCCDSAEAMLPCPSLWTI